MTNFRHFASYVKNAAVLLITVYGPAATNTNYIIHNSLHSF